MLRLSLTFSLWLILPGLLLAGDWPQFRGPDGQGHSPATGLPLTWAENENIAWKVPVEGRGWSSASIRGDQIWLTTALDEGHSLHAVCLKRSDGSLVHDVEVFHKENPAAIHSKNSHASPTPILAGNRVYVHYGMHGTAALTTDGSIVWKTEELKYNHRHGPGGSPVLWKDLLIFNCDGTDLQYVVALDKNTGKIRWKQDRKHISEARRTGKSNSPMAYSTPLLIDVQGKTQLITTASDHVVAYDPASGEEIWWATYDGYSNVPRPVYGHGMVFVSAGYDKPILYAVRVDGRGDVTESHVAWSMEKAAPLNPSPLLLSDELYVVSDNGIATCLDAETGKQHWQKRLGGNFSASPVFAEGRIYLLDEDATTTVIEPGKEFKQLASNKLDGRSLASIAVAGSAIYLRTDGFLYRIEKH